MIAVLSLPCVSIYRSTCGSTGECKLGDTLNEMDLSFCSDSLRRRKASPIRIRLLIYLQTRASADLQTESPKSTVPPRTTCVKVLCIFGRRSALLKSPFHLNHRAVHFVPNPRLAGAGLKIALCEDGGDAGRVEHAFVVVVRAETRRGHRDVPGLLGLPPEGSAKTYSLRGYRCAFI